MSAIHFAQIREDAEVERSLVGRFAPERLVVIGSGGCTALSLLSDSVRSVVCIDSNPAQCALIELRKAAIAMLDRESYMAFIGDDVSVDRWSMYIGMRYLLPRYASAFWDANRELISGGINHCGSTERFYRFVSANIVEHLVGRAVWESLLECDDLADQRALYDAHFRCGRWRTGLAVLLSRRTHMEFFPAFMFARADAPDFGEFFRLRFENEVLHRPMAGNYFLSQFMFGTYRQRHNHGLPYYMTATGFEQAKRNLSKLVVRNGDIADAGSLTYEGAACDAFFLSNAFDWMSPQSIERTWLAMSNAAAPGAVVLFRNMLSTAPVPHIAVERFTIDRELSERCTGLERSMMYEKLTVGVIGAV